MPVKILYKYAYKWIVTSKKHTAKYAWCAFFDRMTFHLIAFIRVCFTQHELYLQVSNIIRTWVGNEVVEHSDVFGASPVGAAPTASSFSTEHLASMYCAKTTASRVEKRLSFGI